MLSRHHAFALCVLASAAGCAGADPGDPGPSSAFERPPTPAEGVEVAGVSMNGVSMNGVSMNGVSMNGVSMNGVSMNGVSMNGVSMNGVSMNGVSMNGSELNALDAEGAPVGGADLVGAEFPAALSSGAALALRVDGARLAGDVWFYRVSYETTSGRQPLCGLDGQGAPVEAVALAGRWDSRQGVEGGGSWIDEPDAFTFGCRGAALAKCVELGYKPWATSAGGTPLREHHQACTRLLRADYCGNGQPGTINGWQVNLYDNVGVQSDTEGGAQWVFEGAWSGAGASCVDEYRALELTLSGPVPDCALARLSDGCVAGNFSGGVLLRSEYNSSGVIGLVRDIVTGDPEGQIAHDVEAAIGVLESAFADLATTPPDRVAALGKFQTTSDNLKAAIAVGFLPAAYGNGLLSRVAGVARFQATSAIGENACEPQDAGKLTKARNDLAAGDAKRSQGKYKEACAEYKKSVVAAQDADGARCAAP